MDYDSELSFLRRFLRKCGLQTWVLDTTKELESNFDLGIRSLLDCEIAYDVFQKWGKLAQPNTICRLTDQFLCTYLILELPNMPLQTLLMIGPYMTMELTRERLQEYAKMLF